MRDNNGGGIYPIWGAKGIFTPPPYRLKNIRNVLVHPVRLVQTIHLIVQLISLVMNYCAIHHLLKVQGLSLVAQRITSTDYIFRSTSCTQTTSMTNASIA